MSLQRVRVAAGFVENLQPTSSSNFDALHCCNSSCNLGEGIEWEGRGEGDTKMREENGGRRLNPNSEILDLVLSVPKKSLSM